MLTSLPSLDGGIILLAELPNRTLAFGAFLHGATVQDMKDYFRPILRRNPDTIVLHVGTNDVTGNKASKVMDDIDSLCQEIKETNPGVEITLSELTTRDDNPEAKKTVTEVNTLFENYCTATNMLIVHLIYHRKFRIIS
jgi:lysophospholipase L1-like esterase